MLSSLVEFVNIQSSLWIHFNQIVNDVVDFRPNIGNFKRNLLIDVLLKVFPVDFPFSDENVEDQHSK